MRSILAVASTLVFLFVTAGPARAAGFALFEHSVKGLGSAFAGMAARAEDPSTVFFNPAGMTLLEGQQAQAALYAIMPDIKFSREEATNVVGAPLSGGGGGQGGVNKVVPNAYYTYTPENDWAFGIGVNVPFGLATSYDRTWVGRYHAVESDVLTININPSVAYRLNEQWSFGAGVNAQHIDALLSQMVDFGLAALGPAGSQTADVFSELNADDWSFGYNLGLLYEFSADTRVGLSYRSRVKHELEGDATFDFSAVPDALLPAATAAFRNQGVHGDIKLPANAELSFYHRLNDRWTALADIQWTEWSTFDKLVVEFDGGLPDSVTTEDWEDSWRYAVGAAFAVTDAWTLRGGVSFDETPIPDAERRTPRLPGEDRVWLALGAGYDRNNWTFDFGYVHVFVKDARINKDASVPENAGLGNLKGEFDFSANEVSVAATCRF